MDYICQLPNEKQCSRPRGCKFTIDLIDKHGLFAIEKCHDGGITACPCEKVMYHLKSPKGYYKDPEEEKWGEW